MSIFLAILSKLSLILKQQVKILTGQEEIKRLVSSIPDRITLLENNLSERLARIESLILLPTPPLEPISVWRMLSERKVDEMWLLTYEADLPPVPEVDENKDVSIQRVNVLVDDVQHSTQDLPRLAEKVTFEVPKGSTVSLTRKLVDDDGNEGDEVASQSFVAKDTIRPSAPGDFGELRNIGEREVPDPV